LMKYLLLIIKNEIMKKLIGIGLICVLFSCNSDPSNSKDVLHTETNKINTVTWTIVDTIDVAGINSDLDPEKPTVDVGIYYPSNLDPRFNRVDLSSLVSGFLAAKEIYSETSVQFRLLWVKTGEIDARFFTLRSSEIPETPGSEFINVYEEMLRSPAVLTKKASEAFESIIEPGPDNHRTIYLVALQDVYFPFYEIVEGERNWILKFVRTSALSFPSYSYVDELPDRLKGIITISNLTQAPEEARKVIAHEIGHKIINVSHEYLTTNPGFEVFGEGGLMIYGRGLKIPSGKEGRYHLERLLLSPYIYKLDKSGNKIWNDGYMEGGHYYDPLYGDKVIYY